MHDLLVRTKNDDKQAEKMTRMIILMGSVVVAVVVVVGPLISRAKKEPQANWFFCMCTKMKQKMDDCSHQIVCSSYVVDGAILKRKKKALPVHIEIEMRD